VDWLDYSVARWLLKGIKISSESSNECGVNRANIAERGTRMAMDWNSRCSNSRRFALLSFWTRQAFCAGTPGTDAPHVDRGTCTLPKLNAVFVSMVEFGSGVLLILGALTPVACVMLGGVMIIAIATTAIRNIKASSLLGRLSEFLYLSEVLYLVILFWLFLSGPGWLSVDHLILSKTSP
jgi:uncharacterized membrane protein YphA (DoxX/SURF4 family)